MTRKIIAQLAAAWLLSLASPAAYAQDEDAEGLDLDELFDEDIEEGSASINDPLEGLNRAIFGFNDFLYRKAFTPLARGYDALVPDAVEQGISNVFDNAKYPSRLVGNLLQGRLKKAGSETGKFVVDSTIGLGGILKPSDEIEALQTSDEDIGQALASWGLGHGFYFVMPFVGPTSLRDMIGDFADGAVEPIPEPWTQIDSDTTRIVLRGVELVNNLPGLTDLYESLLRSSIDPYSAMRDAYAQRRARQVEE